MIGTAGALYIAIIKIVFAGLLGIVAGGFACLVLRRPWSPKSILIDALVAIVFAMVAVYAFTVLAVSRGIYTDITLPVWGVAVLSVIARHLLARRERAK